jgi:hypothetical protein
LRRQGSRCEVELSGLLLSRLMVEGGLVHLWFKVEEGPCHSRVGEERALCRLMVEVLLAIAPLGSVNLPNPLVIV